MSVTNISIPVSRVGVLNVTSIVFGLEVEVIDTDGATAYVDIYGDERKAERVALKSGGKVLDQTISIPGEPEGVGLENENASGREVYSNLMGKPNFK